MNRTVKNVRGSLDPAYPFNFYGLIPNPPESPFHDHEQSIFDREQGGRFVTLIPADLDDNERPADFDILERGYTRHIEASTAFSLLLNIVRIRYCQDLSLDDDYGIIKEVADNIAAWDLEAWLQDESNLWPACEARYFANLDEMEATKSKKARQGRDPGARGEQGVPSV